MRAVCSIKNNNKWVKARHDCFVLILVTTLAKVQHFCFRFPLLKCQYFQGLPCNTSEATSFMAKHRRCCCLTLKEKAFVFLQESLEKSCDHLKLRANCQECVYIRTKLFALGLVGGQDTQIWMRGGLKNLFCSKIADLCTCTTEEPID